MDKPLNRTRENIKTVVIVVLFLSAILLSSFLWGAGSLREIRSSIDDIFSGTEDAQVPSISQVVSPQEIVVNFSTDLYTVLSFDRSGVWEDSLDQLKAFSRSEGLFVEEISVEQLRNVMSNRSVRAEFAYSIPFKDFCEQYEILWNSAFDQVGNLTHVGYSTANPESLFVYDDSAERAWRLVAPGDYTEFEAIIEEIESRDYESYYSAGTYFGVENQTVIPLSLSTNLAEVSVKGEGEGRSEDEAQRLAETFFGESFDFIRKITESRGGLVYMYGYSQKVLTFNADGSIEYKQELSADGTDQTWFQALNTAVQFAATHGGWPENLRLVWSEPVEQDRARGWHFVFGTEVNGYPIYSSGFSGVVQVDVLQGQVTYYSRDLLSPNRQDLEAAASAAPWEAFPAVNAIAQNYEYLSQVLLEAGMLEIPEGSASEEIFNQVAEQLDSIHAGYYWEEGAEDMVPAWCLSLGQVQVWLSLYDAYPLGYQVQ